MNIDIREKFKKGTKEAKKALEASRIALKIKRTIQALQKVITFIVNFWWVILIALLIICVIIPLIRAYAMQLGSTPHFYCDLEAPDAIKATEVYQRYCNVQSKGGNGDLVEAALSLVDPCNQIMNQDAAGDKWGDYKKIADETGVTLTDGRYDNCPTFVATAVRWALTEKIDTTSPHVWAEPSNDTFHNSNWEEVDIENREPGDVFVSEAGGDTGQSHTFIYVGEEALHEKFPEAPADHDCVHAGWKAMMPVTASFESAKDSKPKWYAFRWVGEVDTQFKDLAL